MPDQPNVLLVIADTVRASNCSLYGYHRRTTPNLEQFAEEGQVYSQAIAPAPWSLPSHASIFTGKYPTEGGLHGRKKVLRKGGTVATDLLARGYRTAVITANPFPVTGSQLERGFEKRHLVGLSPTIFDDAFNPAEYVRNREHSSGFAKVRELASWLLHPPRDLPKNIVNAAYYKLRTEILLSLFKDDSYDSSIDDGATEILEETKRWIREGGDPFFACLNFMEAHSPLRHREQFLDETPSEDLYKDRWAVAAGNKRPSKTLIDATCACYDGEIAYLDGILGELFDFIETEGILNETMVVITSDHGEFVGEHDLFAHAYNRLYEPVIRVPLVIKPPGDNANNGLVSKPVSLTDIRNTVVNVADSDESTDARLPVPDKVKAEFVALPDEKPPENFEETFRNLGTRSTVVYSDGQRYLLFRDGRVQVAPIDGEFGSAPAVPDREDRSYSDVPDEIVDFSKITRPVDEGDELDHTTEVQNRLRRLGYVN